MLTSGSIYLTLHPFFNHHNPLSTSGAPPPPSPRSSTCPQPAPSTTAGAAPSPNPSAPLMAHTTSSVPFTPSTSSELAGIVFCARKRRIWRRGAGGRRGRKRGRGGRGRRRRGGLRRGARGGRDGRVIRGERVSLPGHVLLVGRGLDFESIARVSSVSWSCFQERRF